jgi:hypothetical protein
MEDKDSLIGKKMKGFKFSGHTVGYNFAMDNYIGVIGTIKSVRSDTVTVKFPNYDTWSYPYPEILNHLVVEEELTIEQILNNIKNLTKQI